VSRLIIVLNSIFRALLAASTPNGELSTTNPRVVAIFTLSKVITKGKRIQFPFFQIDITDYEVKIHGSNIIVLGPISVK
jgi:hypothetical protein